MPTLFRLRHPRRAHARRQVDRDWQRLINGDMTVIAHIPENCRARVLDTAWDQVAASAWDALAADYNEAQTRAAAAYTIEGTP